MKMKFMGMVLVFLCVSGPYAFAADSMTKRISEGFFFDGDNLDGNFNDFFDSSNTVPKQMKCAKTQTPSYYTCRCEKRLDIFQACSKAMAKNQAATQLSCSKSDVTCTYCGTNSCSTD